MGIEEIPKIDLELTCVHVEPEVRKTKWKVVYGKPIVEVHRSAWKQFGINNRIQYWIWKYRIRNGW